MSRKTGRAVHLCHRLHGFPLWAGPAHAGLFPQRQHLRHVPPKRFHHPPLWRHAGQYQHAALPKNSLIVGSLVSVASTAIGLPAAIALTRYRCRRRARAERHDAAADHSLHRHLRGPAGYHPALPAIDLSLWTVGTGHILLCIPFSMTVLMSRLEGFDKSLEEASRDLGENAWMTFVRVTLPLACRA